MKKRSIILFIMFVVMFFLSGCAATRISLKPSFWQEKELKIGVAVVSYPKVAAHKVGAQGLLDQAINEVLAAELKAYLRQVDITAFSSIADQFVQRLREEGKTVKKIDGLLDLEEFQSFKPTTSGNYTKVDFRSLSQKEDIDTLLLLSIERVGTIRSYYGFIPLGAPKALCQAKGQLVDLNNNEILWLYTMEEKEASVPIEDKWSQPPDYPNLNNALKKAVENAMTILEVKFSQ